MLLFLHLKCWASELDKSHVSCLSTSRNMMHFGEESTNKFDGSTEYQYIFKTACVHIYVFPHVFSLHKNICVHIHLVKLSILKIHVGTLTDLSYTWEKLVHRAYAFWPRLDLDYIIRVIVSFTVSQKWEKKVNAAGKWACTHGKNNTVHIFPLTEF